MQFASLSDLEDRWRADGLGARAVGLNQIGQEDGIAAYCSGREMPLLQDVLEARVMERHVISKDDLLLVDAEGRVRKRVATSQLGFHLLRKSDRDSLVAWIRALP